VGQISLTKTIELYGFEKITQNGFSSSGFQVFLHTLYDENFGGNNGNCHIALGASYSETYIHGGDKLTKQLKKELGFNDSALHWDLVNTEPKRVTALLKGGGKRIIYEDGMFKL